MSNNTKNFVVNQNIPEFIQQDHSLYGTFIGAYYEWLELQNDSENNNYLDTYKAVGNPAYIANNQAKIVDIDETLDTFIDFFANEVVPISLEGIQTNPRFFIKHIRDLYQAKGTTQSFKLFFKLYFNDDIEVFETGDNVLRTSDGKYFNFPTAHFYITEFEDQLDKIDFTLASITDSSGTLIDTVLNGTTVGKTKAAQTIIKAQFTNETTNLQSNTSYFIENADKSYKIKVEAFVSLSEISLSEKAPLYDDNDPIYVDSLSLGKRFQGSVSSVSNGTVNGIKARDKGILYQVGEFFEFENDGNIQGRFTITKTGLSGEILEINNIPLRTGISNNGFLANNLEDVYLSIPDGGTNWAQLPKIKYSPNSSTINTSNPYPKSISSPGIGFQSIPLSSNIGTANSISINQETYFTDSDDVIMNPPATVIVENNTLEVGNKVSFQTFGKLASFGPFTDDSESLKITLTFMRRWYNAQNSTYIAYDSEEERIDPISVVYGFDSEYFNWKVKNIDLDTRNKTNFWQSILQELDSDNSLSYTYVEHSDFVDVIDGESFSSIGDSEYDSGVVDFSSVEPDSDILLNGGDAFDIVGAKIETLVLNITGRFLSSLETYHFNLLDNLIGFDSESSSFIYETTKGQVRLPSDSEDMGEWSDTGYYGEVVGISHNNQVAKIVSYEGSLLPNQELIDSWSSEKYNVVKVSPLDANGVSLKDYSLPLTNVVHQIDRITLNFKTSVVSNLLSKFYNNDGFISDDSMSIRDNYYFSDHSYRIKTQLPFETWKRKFKTLLHPAGMVLTSNFTQNLEAKSNTFNANVVASVDFLPNLTFDQNQEYVDVKDAYSTNADNIYYKSNAFESLNTLTGKARQLDGSSQTSIANLAHKQQNGNAFWDYEPIGWVRTAPIDVFASGSFNLDSDRTFTNRFTTQDSDGFGLVKSSHSYFSVFDGSRQDSYKTQSRLPKILQNNVMISKVQFEDAGLAEYSAYDSDLPKNFYSTFNDSDTNFKSIDYDRLKGENETRYFPQYLIPRTAEIAARKEQDLRLAMRENGSLTWDDSDAIYTDYEAYERKWNYVNNRRTHNVEGYTIKGYLPYVGYVHIGTRSNQRNADFTDLDHRQFSRANAPFNSALWNEDTIVWDDHYINQINNTNVDHKYEQETYKDPRVSMRGRRK